MSDFQNENIDLRSHPIPVDANAQGRPFLRWLLIGTGFCLVLLLTAIITVRFLPIQQRARWVASLEQSPMHATMAWVLFQNRMTDQFDFIFQKERNTFVTDFSPLKPALFQCFLHLKSPLDHDQQVLFRLFDMNHISKPMEEKKLTIPAGKTSLSVYQDFLPVGSLRVEVRLLDIEEGRFVASQFAVAVEH